MRDNITVASNDGSLEMDLAAIGLTLVPGSVSFTAVSEGPVVLSGRAADVVASVPECVDA